MKQKLMTLLLALLFSCVLMGQNMNFKGKVIGNSVPEKGKLYYAKQGDVFSENKIVKYDGINGYEFTISLKTIEKDSVNLIYFTKDIETKQTDEYGCFYKLDIAGILKASKQFDYISKLDFYTDLLITENCEDNFEMSFDARENDLGEIVGQDYIMETPTNKYYVSLKRDYSYIGQLFKVDNSYLSSEIGSWNYNKETKILKIQVVKEINNVLGLVKLVDRIYELKLDESKSEFTFESKGIMLYKNNR